MQSAIKKKGFLLVLIFFTILANAQETDEKSAIKAIKTGNVDSLKVCLEKHQDVNCTFTNGKTGLYYAIVHDQEEITRFLLDEGADPNLEVSGNPPLYWAVKHDRARIARYLIEYGAELNKPDEKEKTPLFYAAELGNLEMCKILVDRGADPLHKNLKGKRASSFAINYTGSPIYEYLLAMEKKREEQLSVPSMQDGPYIFWESDDQVVMTYFERNQETNLTRLIEKTIQVGENDTIVEGFGWDRNSYALKHTYSPNACQVETDGGIFVIGDVHGRYDALVRLLMNNRIIDAEHNWIFGEGHLVLLGDEFDRGGMVTETLWFLHELDIQAQHAGGKVHLLLGNHEIMAMTGDHRYLNAKYNYFTHYFQVGYFQLFENNTALGRWLRSQNLMIRINGYLLVHAGISPQLAVLNFDCSDINSRVRNYLNTGYQAEKGSPEGFILGIYGPLWYRGYGGYGDTEARFPELTQEFVDAYLDANSLRRMILGHNEQSSIGTSFQGKVISADVAIDEEGNTAQGLLISGDSLFRCYADGRKEELVD